MGFSAVIVAGGYGKRFSAFKPKQLFNLFGIPIWEYSFNAFLKFSNCSEIILVVPEEFEKYFKLPENIQKYTIIATGGERRQDSVLSGLKHCNEKYIAIHDAARPLISQNLINRVWEKAVYHDGVIPALKVSETLKEIKNNTICKTISRENIFYIQTPQIFEGSKLIRALENASDSYTDDSGAMEIQGYKIHMVEGDLKNIKLTSEKDLNMAEKMLSNEIRTGFGIDFHRFGKNRKLILGGLEVPHSEGLTGHSDADVLTHAIIDSILGACSKRDIGFHFPDSKKKYRDIESLDLLKKTLKICSFPRILNIDTVIVAEKPKLSNHIENIIAKISGTINIDPSKISVKATTSEGMGPEGRSEGISARSIVTLLLI